MSQKLLHKHFNITGHEGADVGESGAWDDLSIISTKVLRTRESMTKMSTVAANILSLSSSFF
jgi:hypothetical protein